MKVFGFDTLLVRNRTLLNIMKILVFEF